MGTFDVTLGVGNLQGGELVGVSAPVDTGATHTVIPRSLLEQLHVEPKVDRLVPFADGSTKVLSRGQVRIVYDGQEWMCPVIFGAEDQCLLGGTTSEAFELMADPAGQQLVPAEVNPRSF